jgi:replicative DNA helicase
LVKEEDRTVWEDFQNTLDDIEERNAGKKSRGLMCRTFPSLNRFTGGIGESDLLGLLGDYKQGKSYLALQLALDAAIYDRIPVGIFSLEMDKQSVYHRAFSLRTGIDYQKLRNPQGSGLTPEEFQELKFKAERIFNETKIYIADKILDKNRIKAKMKLWKTKYGVKLFVIDYLNLVELNEKKERRDLEIAALSRFFKNTATELQVPIVVLSQVNDKGISAESKALMRDADFLISIRKPIEWGVNEIKVKGKVFTYNENHFEVKLENSRHGRNGYSFIAGFINNALVEITGDEI